MQKNSEKTRRLTQLSLLLAIEIIMAFTPLGMVQIPPVSITIMHIPVIIGGVLMGYGAGAFLGGAFGVLSMIRATFAAAGPVDLAFNPAVSGNPLGSILMAILPRVALGLLAALVYRLLKKHSTPSFAICAAAVVASLAHSFGVLALLSILFATFPLSEVFGIIIGFNGILELAAAAVVGTAVCAGIMRYQKRT